MLCFHIDTPTLVVGLKMSDLDLLNKRLPLYISSLTSDNSEFTEALGREARDIGVPVLRRESEGFFKMLLKLKKPSRILEIGTAYGYSTLIMAENTMPDCRITTIEIGEQDAAKAKEAFERAGVGDRIELIVGDAADVIPELTGRYDFVFLDASKGQYMKFFNAVRGLLAPGGVILSDNVLQGGDVLKSHFIIEQRDRTVHRRMRDFLFAITHDEEFVTSIVPVGDGMAVSVLTTS